MPCRLPARVQFAPEFARLRSTSRQESCEGHRLEVSFRRFGVVAAVAGNPVRIGLASPDFNKARCEIGGYARDARKKGGPFSGSALSTGLQPVQPALPVTERRDIPDMPRLRRR